MSVFALGLNHTTAPLALRERFAFKPEHLVGALHSLRDRLQRAALEAALLSTCNRTELYLVGAAPPQELLSPVLNWLSRHGDVDQAYLAAHTYVAQDEAATRHLFRVASGLDSMVLGEPQILGQMKQAVREADVAGMLGSTLHPLFQRSFAVAKEVRTCTGIGLHSVSMAAAATRLATQLFEDFHDLNVLFVGAGEMIERVATHFSAHRPRSMTLANRGVERAQALAARFDAQSMQLVELPRRLHEFDVVVSCTASTLPLIGLGAVEGALKTRRQRPMLLVDLAVPRDIEPEVRRLRDAYLYTVDDLTSLVQSSSDQRQAAVAQAEAIIEAGVQTFGLWCRQRDSVPLIQALQQRTDDWRSVEIQRARRMLARGETIDSVLDSLAKGLTHKLLHGSLRELRDSQGAEHDRVAQTVSCIFLSQPAAGLERTPPPARR